MTKERAVHADLRAMLMANQPFEYAHLIKFERPSRPDAQTGKPSTAAVRYTYITDASRNIGFDDGSKDSLGNANGTQTYLANKVLNVSEVSESVEAKASNFTVTLDGNGLGAELGSQSMNIVAVSSTSWDIEIVDKNVDPVYEGFREGDKIELYGGQTGTFNIRSFRAGNVVRVTKIDTGLTAGSYSMGFRLSSEEIRSILLDKTLPEYASFINREVFIYKVYQQNGTTVGAPMLLFKGIVSNVGFDDADNGIKVQWGLTSHWGDFSQVKGRITSDDFHRALDQNGNPQPTSALKPEYAYDKGFIHAETSLNMLAKYVVSVEKQDIKTKKGFLGIGAKVKVKKYYVNEDRFTELDFQLQARSIPLHYGVRITEGFPIFADTLKNDSSTVYVIYALGEGPINAIYDTIIDGKSLICSNKGDFDSRSTQTQDETVDIICRGRADRGDVLEGQGSINYGATPNNFYNNNLYVGDSSTRSTSIWSNLFRTIYYQPYVAPTTVATYNSAGKGVVHGESMTLSSPIDMTLDFFGGVEGQAAASQLVELAKQGAFKIQSDYWNSTDTAEYWGPNHTLTDTAYVLAKYKISEGETTIPSLEFILHSKIIDCYNYDYSYRHSDRNTTESADDFKLGDYVDLMVNTSTVINSQVQIIDKWTISTAEGKIQTRFRFSQVPNLNYTDGVPAITRFRMQNGAGKTWTMETFNYVEHSGTITEDLSVNVTPTNVGGDLGLPTGVDPNAVYSSPDSPVLYVNSNLYGAGGGFTTRYMYNDIIGNNLL